jgi:hypothetical protein
MENMLDSSHVTQWACGLPQCGGFELSRSIAFPGALTRKICAMRPVRMSSSTKESGRDISLNVRRTMYISGY